MVKLFQSDPLAFMLEAARIRPPVGGMNPVQYRKQAQIQFPSINRTWMAREGLDPQGLAEDRFIVSLRDCDYVIMCCKQVSWR